MAQGKVYESLHPLVDLKQREIILYYPTRYHFRIYVTVKIHQPLISLCIPEGPIYAEGLYCTTTTLLILTFTKHTSHILIGVQIPREFLRIVTRC